MENFTEVALPQHHCERADSRIFVTVVGVSSRERASICHSAIGTIMHLEPVCGAGELGLRDLTTADVFLAWDNADTIEDLKVQLAIAAHWAPIIAVSQSPTTAEVVRAMKAGASDYIDWQGDASSVQAAVTAAAEATHKVLPKKRWQMEVRRRLRTLSHRENQVLNLMSAGATNKIIAESLGISSRTVEVHGAKLMKKLHVCNTAAAVRIALEAAATAQWIYGDNWLAAGGSEDLNGGNDNV